MKRTDFLRAGAGVTALALAPLPVRAGESDVAEYRLHAAPLRYSPASDVVFDGMAYNGSIPGPVLRVRYGQRLRVRYTSGVDIPTSVHWHGMLLPNAMDGAAYVTQPPVEPGGEYTYEYTPRPPGTRWYHDHGFHMGFMRGLFGVIVVDDPRDEPVDREFVLAFHDVPRWASVAAALAGVSKVPETTVPGSPEASEMEPAMSSMRGMSAIPGMLPANRMGDEVEYVAHCINGAAYPRTKRLLVRVGDRVRLRILNAGATQTRYVRLAGHRLTVTHADGNPLLRSLEVDALRMGVGERYDVIFHVRATGAFALQGLTADSRAEQQMAIVATPGEHAQVARAPQSVEGLDVFSYAKAGGVAAEPPDPWGSRRYDLTLGGGMWGSRRWTINGAVWPNTTKLMVRRGDRVVVRFKNTTDMDHPMHMHGHLLSVVEADGTWLARPLAKDVVLVSGGGGTATLHFTADSPAGRWLLHCHNEIHMADGMMTEVDYIRADR